MEPKNQRVDTPGVNKEKEVVYETATIEDLLLNFAKKREAEESPYEIREAYVSEIGKKVKFEVPKDSEIIEFSKSKLELPKTARNAELVYTYLKEPNLKALRNTPELEGATLGQITMAVFSEYTVNLLGDIIFESCDVAMHDVRIINDVKKP